MSARWSVLGSAAACSGAMYAGVPSATPSEVSAVLPVDSATAFATPKSATSACLPEDSTLSGKHALVADLRVAKAVAGSTGRAALTSLGLPLGPPGDMALARAAA